jgi:hypothetical protein
MSTSSSTSALFDASAESLALRALNYTITPSFFPRMTNTSPVVYSLDVSTLSFSIIDPSANFECGIGAVCLDSDLSSNGFAYTGAGCSCPYRICKSCLLKNITDRPTQYRICPFCRSLNFCPTVNRVGQHTGVSTGYSHRSVRIYRRELTLLEHLNRNGDIWNSVLNGVSSRDTANLSVETLFYFNLTCIIQDCLLFDRVFVDNLPYLYYLCESGYANEVPVPEQFDPSNADFRSSIAVVVRDNEMSSYDKYFLTVLSDDDLRDRVCEEFDQNPFNLPRDTLFLHCLSDRAKNGFGGDADNEFWIEICETENYDLLRCLYRPDIDEHFRSNFLNFLENEELCEFLCVDGLFDTTIYSSNSRREVFILSSQTHVLSAP